MKSTIKAVPNIAAPVTQNPFQGLHRPIQTRIKQIWAVGGGKGGVGKSLLASNLSIALSRFGNKVTAIDVDLGGANLHTALGAELPAQCLGDFITGRVPSLDSCMSASGIPNLSMISGASDSVAPPSLSLEGKRELMRAILTLDTDYVVLDLGAGTSEHTLDFFLFADIGILALLPEPTSIENAYRFLKSTYYRKLSFAPSLAPVKHLIEASMDARNTYNIKNPGDLYREVNRVNAELGLKLKEEIQRFRPKAVLNQVRTQADIDVGFSVKAVCKRYFGIELDYLGYLEYDSAVWQAVRKKRPLILEFPTSRLVSSIERMAFNILKQFGDQKSPLIL